MIRYLKDRGTYVLFNTNGTLLNPKKFQEIIDTGLDELRVSLDAADRESYAAIRGKDFFLRIVRDVGKFTAISEARWASVKPRVSLWLTGLKETVEQLPEFVRLAARMGVNEVHLQRLVFDEAGFGKARPEISLFEQTSETRAIRYRGGSGDRRGTGCDPECLRRHRTRAEPQALGGRQTVGDLPASMVADVFHRARTGAARAASRRSRRAATRIIRWATRPSRHCGRSGTVRPTEGFAGLCWALPARAVPELWAAMEFVTRSGRPDCYNRSSLRDAA